MLADYVHSIVFVVPDTLLIGYANLNCSTDQVTALGFSSFVLEFSSRIIEDLTPNPNEAPCFPLQSCKPISPVCQI